MAEERLSRGKRAILQLRESWDAEARPAGVLWNDISLFFMEFNVAFKIPG